MYNYWCPHRKKDEECTLCNSKGDIQSEDKHQGATCINDEKVNLKLLGETIGIRVGKKYKHRPKKEARERSTTDFKKNILPTLGRVEQKHFKKKFGLKK